MWTRGLSYFQNLRSTFEVLRIKRSSLCYFARFSIVPQPVLIAPKRTYSIEDFSDLINARLQQLEDRQEARQHYGGLLTVLRQQIDAYRRCKASGK